MKHERKMVAISHETHIQLKEMADKCGMKLSKIVDLAIKELQKKLKIVIE